MMKRAVNTRYGSFMIEATERGISRLNFPSSASLRTKTMTKSVSEKERRIVNKTASLLTSYFAGKRVHFEDLPLDLAGTTPFQKKVLKALMKTKPGEVCTYSDLANRAGTPRASRAVGSVMRKNRLPVILPCHRVVRSDGHLGKYSGGLKWKRLLLRLEGARQLAA